MGKLRLGELKQVGSGPTARRTNPGSWLPRCRARPWVQALWTAKPPEPLGAIPVPVMSPSWQTFPERPSDLADETVLSASNYGFAKKNKLKAVFKG